MYVCEHGRRGLRAANTYDEFEVLGQCKLEHGESAVKGIMRIVDAVVLKGVRKRTKGKERRTKQRNLVCRDNASILGWEWARAETRAEKVSWKAGQQSPQRRRVEPGHGSDILDAETLLDKRDNHLELAAVASVARVWD